MANLQIASFNCKHFSGDFKIKFIADIFSKCDFLLLQEHWLHEANFDLFSKLDGKSLCFQGKSAMSCNEILIGRPHGGCVILWKADIVHNVIPIDTVSVRLNCVKVVIDEKFTFLLFNVYMPCDDGCANGNLMQYQDILSEMSVIIHSHDVDNVIVGGDFNTSFARDSPQTRELQVFCSSENFVPCTTLDCAKVSHTFECIQSNSRSEIDHFLVTDSLKESVNQYYSVDCINNPSDHLVLITQLNFHCKYFSKSFKHNRSRPAWYKASLQDVDNYKKLLAQELCKIYVPTDAIECDNINCTIHVQDIENFHNAIVSSCILASQVLPPTGKCVKQSQPSSCSPPPVPGWNDLCAHRKELALLWHWRWKDAGRPKSGHICEMRRQSRLQYHYAVRKAQQYKDKLQSGKLAQSLLDKNVKSFWHDVRKIKGQSKAIPGSVDNVSGDCNIANLFAGKFCDLFNSVGYDYDALSEVKQKVEMNCSKHSLQNSKFMYNDVVSAVKNLSTGKSDGNAGVYSDNIINGCEKLYEYLLLMFNAMISHGCSPYDMNTGTMIPIPKGKRLNICKSDNFRGICLQSIFCKILDNMIFQKEKDVLVTSNLQFGFKPDVSASVATAVVTETIDYYVNGDGMVYSLALDASKAFDRVEYTQLFSHLMYRNVNPYYVRLLLNMYCNQYARVSFNNTTSNYFSIGNGVKQGGVLSPILYCIYVDNLLKQLESSGYGCHVGSKFTGCIGYADDLVLLSPTLYGLKKMIGICENYAREHKIVFNGKKSKLMVFRKSHVSEIADVFVNNEKVERVHCMKYLGHMLYDDRNNSLVSSVNNDFKVQVNTFLGSFQRLTAKVKNNLFLKYCMSFYGSNLCSLYDKSMEQLYVSHRKSLRKIWSIPSRTHNKLLPHISDHVPMEVTLYKRFMKFFCKGMLNENDTVSFIFNHAIHNSSRLGKNLLFICKKYKLNIRRINSCNYDKEILDSWIKSCCTEDVRVGHQIREIVEMRDSLEPWLLDYIQCNNMIEYLAVM